MDYESAVAYIDSIPKFTKKTTLDHTDRLLDKLDHPEKNLKILHVAGTNGKGSVCAYLNSMLQQGGYKVGMFTSPHLIRINERFQINTVPVSDDLLVWSFERVMAAVEETKKEGDDHPTYFETLLLMCLLIFQREQVDYCVLEVGMGGRLDATNVIKHPLASIIASISLDHTEYLGDTIAKIAFEKAGIIKPGIPVIYDAHVKEAADVIAARAKEQKSPAYPLTMERYEEKEVAAKGITFDFHTGDGRTYRLTIPSVARYQMMNASLAFMAMLLLEKEHNIPVEKLEKGIHETVWPCRMETVLPGVVIDGAHNIDGIAQFVATVADFHKEHEITILFSAVNDKLYDDMIREIAEGVRPERVVTATIPGPRGSNPEMLADLFRRFGVKDVTAMDDPGRAFDCAYKKKGGGLLFCVGSLYLAGMVKDWINRHYR
ncbi:MAG: folylpolyglutamate synthase/dihydrofolate synthase family protein [Eubacterium sp.]|nr:folylpolyglutamate synthase/dihydrofolate synthase family protein [Eubacterium sp.]